ncbi:MAG: DNA repair exonuclease [Candidatus Aenigmatarchaeota archaeon]
MKIAILSDFHFGVYKGEERENDSYDAFQEAIEKSIGCDAFIFAGDIFHNKNPDVEILTRAMELMLPILLKKSETKLLEGIRKDVSKIPKTAVMGTPIIAIHGTHERRIKDFINPVEGLEKAGFLIYLNCNGVILEKNGERVAIQGMSGVDDRYALETLENWKPLPIKGCFNILVLHQSISPFLYAEHTLDINKLPKNFDLYINGHIHEALKTEYNKKPFLLSGSLIPTQLKEESQNPKGFWVFDTQTKDVEWRQLEKQRKIYVLTYDKKILFEQIEKDLKRIADENKDRKKPVVKINLQGESMEILENKIKLMFQDKLILNFYIEKEEKEIFESKTLEEQKLSVEELGKKILLENLQKENLDVKTFENVFELLSENKNDEAESLIIKRCEKNLEKKDEEANVEERALKKSPSKQSKLFQN